MLSKKHISFGGEPQQIILQKLGQETGTKFLELFLKPHNCFAQNRFIEALNQIDAIFKTHRARSSQFLMILGEFCLDMPKTATNHSDEQGISAFFLLRYFMGRELYLRNSFNLTSAIIFSKKTPQLKTDVAGIVLDWLLEVIRHPDVLSANHHNRNLQIMAIQKLLSGILKIKNSNNEFWIKQVPTTGDLGLLLLGATHFFWCFSGKKVHVLSDKMATIAKASDALLLAKHLGAEDLGILAKGFRQLLSKEISDAAVQNREVLRWSGYLSQTSNNDWLSHRNIFEIFN